MTTLIKNSVIHFAKILKVYTALALVGAGIAVLAQLGASLRHYSIENIALIVGIIFICFLIIFTLHIQRQSKKPKHKSEEAVSPDISPRLKKS